MAIRAVVGSRVKAYAIQQHYHQGTPSTLDLTVVSEQDLPVKGTFNDALSDYASPFHTVVHTLSTGSSEAADCLAKFISLESETIINFLRSIQQIAKFVRRVVIITSLTPFARWQQVEGSSGGGFLGGQPSPATNDPQYNLATSQAGDNIVYDAVSKWTRDSGAQFDIVYITAPSCYGPAVRPLETSSDVSEANRRIWNICSNEHGERLGTPPFGITHFLDVRDLALAGVRAIFASNAGNKRFLISAGTMPSGSEIAEFLVACFPEMKGRIRTDGSPPRRNHPENLSLDLVNTHMAATILGLSEYRSAEATLVDTAGQILDLQRRKEWKRIIQS
ncbi:hypothetical protein BKA66DRAFT_442980 [Pyrenochaeta sp. MPI-SDFR-AT-0127]|nr:hypothetical protein BKA66DRAFT_442980 [Pyrenochaeta sp. MPI-SDFR-AT-0127]